MNTASVKETLSDAIDRVAARVYEDRVLLAKTDQTLALGDYSIRKIDKHNYAISKKTTGESVFERVYLLEAALLLAKYLNTNNSQKIKRIIELENRYAKNYTDMVYFSEAHKHARSTGDYERMAVTEDRYVLAKHDAQGAKEALKVLCNRFAVN